MKPHRTRRAGSGWDKFCHGANISFCSSVNIKQLPVFLHAWIFQKGGADKTEAVNRRHMQIFALFHQFYGVTLVDFEETYQLKSPLLIPFGEIQIIRCSDSAKASSADLVND